MKQVAIILFFCAMTCAGTQLKAQDDLSSWSSVLIHYKIDDTWDIRLRPITRHRDNLGTYSDTSLDFILRHKTRLGLDASILMRHFFIPNDADRQFFFFDFAKSVRLSEKFTLANTLRYHLASNINDRIDPDFIRYQPKLIYQLKPQSKPYVMLDPFYRVTEPASLAGARYIVGYDQGLKNGLGFNFEYWYQKGYGDNPIRTSHFLILTLRKFLQAKPTT